MHVLPVHRLNESYTHTFQGDTMRESIRSALRPCSITVVQKHLQCAGLRSGRSADSIMEHQLLVGQTVLQSNQCQLQGNGSLLTRGSY